MWNLAKVGLISFLRRRVPFGRKHTLTAVILKRNTCSSDSSKQVNKFKYLFYPWLFPEIELVYELC